MHNGIDRKALWDISYGLYVVTSISGGRKNGQIVNTVFQVSADPPKVAVSINKDNLTHQYITDSGVFAVSVLEQATPLPFIGLFGFKSGREVDKFAGLDCGEGHTGCPMVTEHSLAVFECKVVASADAGTHTIFVGEVLDAEVLRAGTPLTYAYYQEVKKGKASKNAPTYKGDQAATEKSDDKRVEVSMQKYVCGVCGYIYDPAQGDPDGGIAAGTAFEDLPEDWTCPVCGASKDEFAPE